jgi:ParB-like chromosome segregation protein Spo0J
MMSFSTQTLEADLHRLDLRFASLRIRQPRAVERLARSIEQSGQLVPLVAVAEAAQWVLIDGFLRLDALRRLGRDTARMDLWDCPLDQALLIVLVRLQGRTWEAIEEGAVIRALLTEFALSRREVARQAGRDVSWVSRRLSLVEGLPEALFVAICQGELSTWAATRVLAPLARANPEHAQRLLAGLQRDPLSTRELHTWYQHYQKANRPKRQRMLDEPRLFCQALRSQARDQVARDLRAGPEGAWVAEWVFAGVPETGSLQQAWVELKTLVHAVDDTLARYIDNDCSGHSRCDSGPARQGHGGAQDRPPAEALAQHRAPDAPPALARGTGGTADPTAYPAAAATDLCPV